MAVIMANRSSEAGSGARGAPSPPKGVRRDKLVVDVVDNLKPWKNNENRQAITAAVNEQLDTILKLVPLQEKLYDRRSIRKHADRLGKAVRHVQKLLATSPPLLAVFLFDPRPALMLDDNLKIERAVSARAEALATELERLLEVCDRARNYGMHPNHDHAKELSAHLARILLQKYSEAKITGTENRPFRIIASRVYEVMCGQKDADLKRACDDVLRKMYPMNN
jgi:hypothetical protein